jgi:DNA modification methylase
MAKIKPFAQQTSLFKRDIPQMPEGYYSSGPNLNLSRFVEEHATPYDPATDNFAVPPFDQPITTTKATAIYNMHSYHQGKKPHDAIRQFIRHYTQPGDIVLDPFCGSGGTALAALLEGRDAIAIDISPAATFITKHYCTPVDLRELQKAFENLQSKVESEIDWLYGTRCDRCDGRARIDHTVYSYLYQCPRCLEKVPFFDCMAVEGQTGGGKPKMIQVCPRCFARGHTEEIGTHGKRFDLVPVLVSYLCEEGCKPQRGERRHNDPDPKKRAFFEQYDLGKLREIEVKKIPHWYPPHRMMNVESDTEPWGDKWRAGTSNFRTVAELFTKRNLWALSALFAAIEAIDSDVSSKHVFKISATGFLRALSKMQRYYPESSYPDMTIPGTYYLPPSFAEENVYKYFCNKFYRNLKGLELINRTIVSTECIISTQSATDMHSIPPNSVDYIYTDPPYSNNVQYGELNFVWEAWLGFNTDWHDQEIIVNETRNKSEISWASSMQQAMTECYRILKPGRWLSLCYHDTSEGTWQLVQDIMAEVGFIAEQIEGTLYIDTEQKSYNQYTADKVTKRDLVINFRKPRPGELIDQLTLFGDEDAATFAEKARAILREALETRPGSPADRLYDELVSRMVRKGEFERHDFDALLRSVAENPGGDGRWYLVETADQTDEAESAKEAAAAARLEVFMQVYLAERPEEGGVHYSDLFEQYLPIQDKPRRLLADWLPEFFFRTPEGTWRPPVGAEERAQKEALRAAGTLRHIKRFAKALLEGVPPSDRDRPANVATAADWLRQCRRAGLYELGRALYEKGGFRFEELGDEGQLETEEDYQVCVRRS